MKCTEGNVNIVIKDGVLLLAKGEESFSILTSSPEVFV